MKARWRVATYAVDGTCIHTDDYRRRGAAVRALAKAELEIPEPIPGRPLYTLKLEPIT